MGVNWNWFAPSFELDWHALELGCRKLEPDRSNLEQDYSKPGVNLSEKRAELFRVCLHDGQSYDWDRELHEFGADIGVDGRVGEVRDVRWRARQGYSRRKIFRL
jgi:hypothetical protein